jgi:hypothetical protein
MAAMDGNLFCQSFSKRLLQFILAELQQTFDAIAHLQRSLNYNCMPGL